MRLIALVALLIAAPAAFSGCVCEPLLDVRFCREAQSGCDPHSEDVRAWSQADANQFPEVQEWLDKLAIGEHGHIPYTPELEAAFWEYWGVDNSNQDQQIFLEYQQGIYRLRLYSCTGPR